MKMNKLTHAAIYVLLAVLCFVFLMPIVWVVFSSFKTGRRTILPGRRLYWEGAKPGQLRTGIIGRQFCTLLYQYRVCIRCGNHPYSCGKRYGWLRVCKISF